MWQQAPVLNAAGTDYIGNTSLWYSYSTDEGVTWSMPVQIPTPGLNNNVMTWASAGDDGRVDIVWYGTPATVTPPLYDPTACVASGAVPPPTPRGGPDFANGVWGLYMVQTLNGHGPGPVSFTPPILASGHHNHRGTVATVMGALCGDRTALGDFLQMRIGPQGEANIIYSDSNNTLGTIGHTMFVRQNGGSGVYGIVPVSGDPILLNAASDPAGDGRRELNGMTSGNLTNLDITGSSISKPNPADCHPAGTACYRVQMTLNSLSLTPPPGETDIVWHTQWLTPSHPTCAGGGACATGGRNFHVYAESNAQGLRCFFGDNSIQAVGGGVTMTYPPAILDGITAPGACTATNGAGGTITIEVPIDSVSLETGVPPLNPNRVYSVTASTMTLTEPSDSVPAFGVLFDVIDVVRGYDALFTPTAVSARSFGGKRHGVGARPASGGRAA